MKSLRATLRSLANRLLALFRLDHASMDREEARLTAEYDESVRCHGRDHWATKRMQRALDDAKRYRP